MRVVPIPGHSRIRELQVHEWAGHLREQRAQIMFPESALFRQGLAASEALSRPQNDVEVIVWAPLRQAVAMFKVSICRCT